VTDPDGDVFRWVADHTALLLSAVDGLDDEALSAPSALPGWSRRHLLSHVGFNAEALRRLLHWARTMEPTPMYASKEQRAQEIADGATWEAARLREFVRDSSAALARDIDALEPQHWTNEVVTAQGRTVRAHEIVWLRAREVCVHGVDLDTGLGVADLPPDFCRRLVTDIAALRSTRQDGPRLRLLDEQGDLLATVDGAGESVTVSGDVNSLAGWLAGRGRGPGSVEVSGHRLPELPAWI
jgi:maleylpyruvate isomerase